jgi:hypothetical protein
LSALLVSCATPERSEFVTIKGQPTNVGDAKIAAQSYHDSDAYDRDLARVANKAASWITERAPNVHRPALVLDIEETALSNWEIIKLDDFGRPIAGPCEPGSGAPCGWGGLGSAWTRSGNQTNLAGISHGPGCERRCVLYHWASGITARGDRTQLAKGGFRRLYPAVYGAERRALRFRC